VDYTIAQILSEEADDNAAVLSSKSENQIFQLYFAMPSPDIFHGSFA
jgi:hypothetical protein